MATASCTFLELLSGVNAYPIPQRTLLSIAATRGLDLEAVATSEDITGDTYNLARADVFLWLADAPDVAQGGINYSFSDEQRKRFRSEAMAVYNELEPKKYRAIARYGYKGSRL